MPRRPILLFIVALVLLAAGGCQSSKTPAEYIENNRDNVRIAASLAANVGILAAPQEDRVKLARLAYDVARGVEDAAADEAAFNLSTLDGVVAALLDRVGEDHRAIAAAIVSTVRNIVRSRLDSELLIESPWQLKALRAFTVAAAQGVQDVALAFAGGIPQPGPGWASTTGRSAPDSAAAARAAEQLGDLRIPIHEWK